MLAFAFQETNSLVHIVVLRRPWLFYASKYIYTTIPFYTPFITSSTALSSLCIFRARHKKQTQYTRLTKYPELEKCDAPYIMVGDVQQSKRRMLTEAPRCLVIPDRGLFTGIAILWPSEPENPSSAENASYAARFWKSRASCAITMHSQNSRQQGEFHRKQITLTSYSKPTIPYQLGNTVGTEKFALNAHWLVAAQGQSLSLSPL